MKRSSRPRATAELSKSLHRQLSMYTLAGSAAGVGMLALAPPAEAKIIYTPAHALVGRDFPLDLNHDGIVDFYLTGAATIDSQVLEECKSLIFSYCTSGPNPNAVRSVHSQGGRFGAALRYGDKIQRGEQFSNEELALARVRWNGSPGTTLWFGPWFNGGKGVKNRYLGLKFKIKGRFHFGWARMTVTTAPHSFTPTLTGYAYETIPGKAIVAGQTTGSDVTTVDPASLGHLAAGASAIQAWRVEQTAATTH